MTEKRFDANVTYRVTGVDLTDTAIVLTLADMQTLTEPFRRHVRLEKATPAEREQWRLTDDGHGVNWPKLWEPSSEGMVSVWAILQDRLYDAALARLKTADWNMDAISPRDCDLVALWRAEADINNGGFLQFLGNWGICNHDTAVAALEAIGATVAASILRRMFNVVELHFAVGGIESISDIHDRLTEVDKEHLEKLDEAFWEFPDPLTRLVVQHYGREQASGEGTRMITTTEITSRTDSHRLPQLPAG
ncbi:DMP19 family protein [Rhodococcus sp. OK302]|uniref:DMP19 family protein n=1 Tax=Rhodococcus sp. OK302 TaxID=1882769 RepID=UPI000B9F80A7|nr:DUF4375 domain-containing protein [Rhodococcus sp. OK302]OYD70433.1 uncharacterized protein DUF2442 [Rhodococcus sp. OK302]